MGDVAVRCMGQKGSVTSWFGPPRSSSLACLLFAIVVGSALPFAATLTPRRLAMIGAGIVFLLVIGLWRSTGWPIEPLLRAALPASLSFRLEINLFPQFRYHENPPGLNISLVLVISLLLLAIRVIRWWRGEKPAPVRPPGLGLVMAAMWLWCLLSAIKAPETWLAFCMFWSMTASCLICYVTAGEFAGRSRLRAGAITIAAGIGLNGVAALLQTTLGWLTDLPVIGAGVAEGKQLIGDHQILRATGFLEMANNLAWYLVSLSPLPLALLILPVGEFRGRSKRLLMAASALAVVALILSYSRGGWLVFASSIFMLVALARLSLPQPERGPFLRAFARRGLFGLALALLLCLPFAGSIYQRLTEDDGGSAQSREPLMQVALAMIADNKWLGVGLASYEAEMRRYDKTPDRISDDFDWPVHNIYLHMTAEAGIPTTIFFLILIAIAVRSGWRTLRCRDPLLRALSVGLLTGLAAYLLTGLKELGSVGSPQLRLCFFLIGLLPAVENAARRERSAEP